LKRVWNKIGGRDPGADRDYETRARKSLPTRVIGSPTSGGGGARAQTGHASTPRPTRASAATVLDSSSTRAMYVYAHAHAQTYIRINTYLKGLTHFSAAVTEIVNPFLFVNASRLEGRTAAERQELARRLQEALASVRAGMSLGSVSETRPLRRALPLPLTLLCCSGGKGFGGTRVRARRGAPGAR
jgi:hypothetical protein